MKRQNGNRAAMAAMAIVLVTISRLEPIRCGCSHAAWGIEIATAVIFSLWIVASRK
jgi:hypothetical protein